MFLPLYNMLQHLEVTKEQKNKGWPMLSLKIKVGLDFASQHCYNDPPFGGDPPLPGLEPEYINGIALKCSA